jgi:hypothetical protein
MDADSVAAEWVSQMSEAKSSTKNSGALKLWTERLTPALGAALLPELIRLIGQYCLSQLLWSPVHSKRIRISDADAEGCGLSLDFLCDPPAGETEAPAPSGWYAARSVAPLSELAGGSPDFSWTVRLENWVSSACIGVALPTASLTPQAFGADGDAYGLCFVSPECLGPYWVHDNLPMGLSQSWWNRRTGRAEPIRYVRFTADLAAGTLRFAVQTLCEDGGGGGGDAAAAAAAAAAIVPEKPIAIPQLERYHLHPAGAPPVRVILLTDLTTPAFATVPDTGVTDAAGGPTGPVPQGPRSTANYQRLSRPRHSPAAHAGTRDTPDTDAVMPAVMQ